MAVVEHSVKIGNGVGFKRSDGEWAMIRCFDCGEENYASTVMSGLCV